MNSYFIDLILFFSLYSFMGWILETISASIVAKRFINRGFLFGPFCPIYGFGAILIIQSAIVLDGILKIASLSSLIIKIVVAIIFATLLEYFTGAMLEKIFKRRWWDYSNEFLNIKGRVCLKYSIMWGIMAYILIKFIHPLYSQAVIRLPLPAKHIFSLFIVSYLMYDMIKTIGEILNLKQMIFTHHQNLLEQLFNRIIRHKRIFFAFPKLYFPHTGNTNQKIRGFLNDKVEKLKTQIKIK